MEYRVNRRTGDRISVLGVGTSGLPAAGAKEGAATLEMALEQGINYFDLATADSACFPIFGAALGGVPGETEYGAQVTLHILLPREQTAEFSRRITELSAGRFAPAELGEVLRDAPRKKV